MSSSSRYFFSENADRPVRIGSDNYPFTVIGRHGGAAQGVIEVSADRAEAFIAVAVGYGVREITQDAYDHALLKKKKTQRFSGSIDRVRHQPTGSSLKDSPAVVEPGSPSSGSRGGAVAPVTIEEAVTVASAATAPGDSVPGTAAARGGSRKKRSAAPEPAAAAAPAPANGDEEPL